MKKSDPRKLINPELLIGELHNTLAILKSGFVPEYIRPSSRTRLKDLASGKETLHHTNWREISRMDLNRYSLQIKSIVSILGKVLPDLKALELNDVSENAGPKLTDAELAQRLTSILASTKAPTNQSPNQQPNQPPPPTPEEEPPVWLN